MLSPQVTTLGAIALYILAMVWIAIRAAKQQNHEGYIIGARNVGLIPTVGSLASSFRDGMGIVFWVQFGYMTGYGGLWLIAGVLLGLLIVAGFGPRVRKIALENNYITVGQMLRAQVGVVTTKLASFLVLMFCIIIVAAQLFVAGNMASQLTDLPYWSGVGVAAVVVALYLFCGGYATVVKTDTLQFFIILSFLFVPLFVKADTEAMFDLSSIMSLGTKDSIALALIGLIYILSGADVWQRLFSARNDRVIRLGFPLAAPSLLIMTLGLIFLGFVGKRVFPVAPDGELFFAFFTEAGGLGPWMQAYVAVVVMAVLMSTMDTFTYLFSSTVLRDFTKVRMADNRDRFIFLARILIVGLLVAASVGALFIGDVVKFLFDMIGFLYVVGPVFVAAGFGWIKPSKWSDIAIAFSVLVGFAVYGYGFWTNMFEDMLLISLPAAISAGGVVLTILAQKLLKRG